MPGQTAQLTDSIHATSLSPRWQQMHTYLVLKYDKMRELQQTDMSVCNACTSATSRGVQRKLLGQQADDGTRERETDHVSGNECAMVARKPSPASQQHAHRGVACAAGHANTSKTDATHALQHIQAVQSEWCVLHKVMWFVPKPGADTSNLVMGPNLAVWQVSGIWMRGAAMDLQLRPWNSCVQGLQNKTALQE